MRSNYRLRRLSRAAALSTFCRGSLTVEDAVTIVYPTSNKGVCRGLGRIFSAQSSSVAGDKGTCCTGVGHEVRKLRMSTHYRATLPDTLFRWIYGCWHLWAWQTGSEAWTVLLMRCIPSHWNCVLSLFNFKTTNKEIDKSGSIAGYTGNSLQRNFVIEAEQFVVHVGVSVTKTVLGYFRPITCTL